MIKIRHSSILIRMFIYQAQRKHSGINIYYGMKLMKLVETIDEVSRL